MLPNSSYGYQIMDRSHHSVTSYMKDEETHCTIDKKTFRRLESIKNQLHEVDLAQFELKHKKAVIEGFFILEYAKFRILGNITNIFSKLRDTDE